MNSLVRSKLIQSAISIILFASLTPLQALETAPLSGTKFEPFAGASVSYTDNATLSDGNEIEDWVMGVHAGIEASYETDSIVSNGFATVSHESYMDDTFDSATYLNLDGNIAWTLLEDRIVLEVQDIFSQKPIRSIDAGTPDNNQDVNAFSIGPLFTLPVGTRNQVIFHPVFRDYYFETSRVDNERFLLYMKWRYLMQPGRELALHADTGKVDYSFDEAGDSPDFDSTKLYASFSSELRLAEYSIHLGVTDIDRQVFSDHDGFYGSLNWLSKLSEASKLSIKLVTDLTDNGTGLLDVVDRLEEGAVIGTGSNVGFSEQLAADIMRNSQFKVAYRRQSSLVNTAILLNVHQLDYKEQPLDRDVFQLGAIFDYKMSSSMSGRLTANYKNSDLKDEDREDDLYTLGLGLSYALSRHYNLSFDLYRQERSSSLDTRDFSENRGILRLRYQ